MPLSTAIRLSKDITPVFPMRCVFSGLAKPDTEVFLIPTKTFTMFGLLFYPALLRFGYRRVHVPIFRKYLTRFYLECALREILVLFSLLTIPLNGVQISVSLICLWSLWETFLPRCLRATRENGSIEYYFASSRYAAEFKDQNSSAGLSPST
jgi:hypothetical protein